MAGSESATPQGSKQYKNKLEEQSHAKEELSYSYWAQNTAAGGSQPTPPPRKLTPEEVAQQQQQQAQQARSVAAPSAWNHAGTFEERDVSTWATEHLKTRLRALAVEGAAPRGQGQLSVVVKEVKSVKGEATVWISRGVRRHGYEFNVELTWRATCEPSKEGDSEVGGLLSVPNACPDELDELDVQVEVQDGKQVPWCDAARDLVRQNMGLAFREALVQFSKDFGDMR